jgi:hypothetical protein
MMCVPVILGVGGSLKNRTITVQAGMGKKQDFISKTTSARRAGGMTQVEESCLE